MVRHIKKYNVNQKIGGVRMATVSFEKDINLSKSDINKLFSVVCNQERKNIAYEKQDTVRKIERGRDLLKQLFSN